MSLCMRTILLIPAPACTHRKRNLHGVSWNCPKNREKGYEEKIFNPIWMSGCGDNGEGAITETKCEIFSQFCHFNFQQILQYFELFVENTLHLAQKYAKILVRANYLLPKAKFPDNEVREKMYITASLEERLHPRTIIWEDFRAQWRLLRLSFFELFRSKRDLSVCHMSIRKIMILLNAKFVRTDNRVELSRNQAKKFQRA